MSSGFGTLLWWTLLVFAAFLFDWVAVALKLEKIKPFAKILAMLSVIVWTMAAVGWRFDVLILLLFMAQQFGLDGDIFLLFADKFFIQGLASFLIGHLFYISLIIVRIVMLSSSAAVLTDNLQSLMVALVVWAGILIVFYSIFGVLSKDNLVERGLWIAIQIYGWVLSGLVALALFAALIFGDLSVGLWFLPIGAFLFLISDSLLAYDRFIKPLWSGQLWVLITYHCAQFCLALGFVTFLRG